MACIELTDISHRYRKDWVLCRVHHAFEKGRVTLLTGDNGAGKTTLLRIISTAMKPTRGQLKIFGLDPATDRNTIRSRMALMTHKTHLYEDLTAKENLELLAALKGIQNPDSVHKILERVGLAAHRQKPMRSFSAGMRRRLVVGGILLRKPDIVLLDEPFGQLDQDGIALIEELLASLKERHATVLLSTHNHRLGKAVSDAHFHMEGGSILSPEEGRAA